MERTFRRLLAAGYLPDSHLITIAIVNRQRKLPVDRRRIRRAIRAILEDAGVAEARVNVAVVDDPTIARLHQHIDAHGQRTGKHHEIYLSDIRKTDPAKWKTILRQPMR